MAGEPDIDATGSQSPGPDTDPFEGSSDGDDTDTTEAESDEHHEAIVHDPDDEPIEPDDEHAADETGQEVSLPRTSRRVCSDRNAEVIGMLTLHYPARDVEVFLDGDSAVRLLTIFKRRHEGELADPLNPYLSSADAGWVVADLLQAPPLAMSWMPGLPTLHQRTAMDPASPLG